MRAVVVGEVRAERPVKDVGELEVGWYRERMGAQVLGLGEPLDREDANIRGGGASGSLRREAIT